MAYQPIPEPASPELEIVQENPCPARLASTSSVPSALSFFGPLSSTIVRRLPVDPQTLDRDPSYRMPSILPGGLLLAGSVFTAPTDRDRAPF